MIYMNKDTSEMELCEKLWNECEPSIRKLCNYKLSAYPSEVDDVVGDIYLALCDAVRKGHKIDNPKAWLFSTANNCIRIKYSEINHRLKKFSHWDSNEQRLFYDVDFENVVVSDDTLEEIKDSIIDELPTPEKTLFILIYVKKLKLKEIAKIMNTTESAVKQRKYRLKLKIKRLIKEKLSKL